MSAIPLEHKLRKAEREQQEKAELKIREAAAGLNVAIRTERSLQGQTVIVAVDGQGREMQISPAFVRKAGQERLRALLAVFAIGATAVVFGEQTVDFDVAVKEEGTS